MENSNLHQGGYAARSVYQINSERGGRVQNPLRDRALPQWRARHDEHIIKKPGDQQGRTKEDLWGNR